MVGRLGETNDKDFWNLYDLFQSKNLIYAFPFGLVMASHMSFKSKRINKIINVDSRIL